MNRKQKGSRGERACRDVWKKHGYEEAHRSQQYSGKGESSADLEGISELLHIEVKSGYSYKTIYDFLDQSIRDAKENQIPIVNCKMDRKEWLCVLRLDDFIKIWKAADLVSPDEYIEKACETASNVLGENVLCKECLYADKDVPYCYLFRKYVTAFSYCKSGKRRTAGDSNIPIRIGEEEG